MYHAVDEGIDDAQVVIRDDVDTGQENGNTVIDVLQEVHPLSNPVSDVVIDAGQHVMASVVDSGQDAFDAVTDWGQGRGEDIHDGIVETGEDLLEKGRGLANKLKLGGIPGL